MRESNLMRRDENQLPIDVEKMLEEMSAKVNKAIEKWIPRKYDLDSLSFTLGPATYKYNTEAPTKAISEPVWNLLDRGGKRWRPALFLLISETLGLNADDFLDFVVFPELLHNGSIIIDDIEDMSNERRHERALHLIFGEDVAINAGNALYFLALLPLKKNIKKLNNDILRRLYELYCEEMMRISFGQAMDIAWHKGWANANDLAEQEYLEMCSNKTGCIARLASKTAAILANRDEKETTKIGEFAETVGIAFQIQDDVLNLTNKEFADSKGGLGEDITEGKRSLPVVHTLQLAGGKDKERLREILKMHTFDQELRNEAITIIRKYNAISYAKDKAREMVKKAWNEIDEVLPEPEDRQQGGKEEPKAKEKLRALAYYLIERDL